MNENIIKIAVLVVVLFIASLGVAVSVGLFPSAVEEGSFAYKYIIPHTEKQVNIPEEEMDMIGEYSCGHLVIYKLHDNKDNVSCWLYRGGQRGGISCIPDHMLTP